MSVCMYIYISEYHTKKSSPNNTGTGGVASSQVGSEASVFITSVQLGRGGGQHGSGIAVMQTR